MSRDRDAARWFARMRGPDAETHRPAFEAWLREPANAAAYARAQDDWEFAGTLSPVRIAAKARPDRPAPIALRWGIATAAALALALALLMDWQGQAERQAPQLAQTNAADGTVKLADGSLVRLMDGARIESRFSRAQRRVVLFGGLARFSVAHDASRPFTVVAGESETTALGTEFEVDLRAAYPLVHLIAGSVEVRATGSREVVRLAPGESAAVQGRRPQRLPRPASPASATMLEADRLPLGAVIAQANRINAVPIRLADPALGTLRLSGKFDIADSPVLARKLAAALNLSVAEHPDEYLLSAR